MAFLSGTFLGYSTMQYQPPIPSPISYNKITLYGGQSIFDKVHIQNIALTNSEIQAIDPFAQILWKPTTLLLANFDAKTLDGGNIISLPSALVGWKIYRRDTSTDISTLIATVDAGTTTYIDYTIGAYRNYVYEIFPITTNEIGSPLVTDNTYADFYGWYLMHYDSPSTVYKFDLNLSSSELMNETNVVIYETYTQKPSVSMGNRDFIKGAISCIAGTINADGKLYQPVDYLNQLKSFINDKNVKLLKSRKGDTWKVITYGMNEKFMDEVSEQLVTITFNFSEVN